MRATIMYGAGDVRIENVDDPSIVEPTDAVGKLLEIHQELPGRIHIVLIRQSIGF